ncbi:MAG: clan AA aspartic protease [Pirellulales bacterium]
MHAEQRLEPHKLTVWIDTGFTGDLVISRQTIRQLGLRQSSAVMAELADGKLVLLDTYSCTIEWFEEERVVEVVESEGEFPLLGVGLLSHHNLMIDYEAKTVSLD